MALTIAILNQLRECLFPTPYSLLPTPCSLFPVPCSLCYRDRLSHLPHLFIGVWL
ncbi:MULTISPECIES: hypothetical protein [unclassified Moorena]|uniref:hypothetical protein n=1 Tax=unclassified Moorena TaxID=2683338 RepID=UPI0013C142AE|nr:MULTISPECIES: hypothetical protein [unclassified Moorena]NEO04203.1 hypothetical protein [Moorena sp. SIO3I8]NEP20840.1 hypothetical protein [Moorena sp. SIO3I6]NEQ57942.1 hypothetical protein [Moorena sp. SIO4A1]